MYIRKAPKHTTAVDVFEQILDKVRLIGSLRASWNQNYYKYSFFRIFDNAWCNSLCGIRAWNRYNASLKRNKSSNIEDFVVQRENIRSYLREHLTVKERKAYEPMIADYIEWWEHWTYAWDYHPHPPSRPYVRRKG